MTTDITSSLQAQINALNTGDPGAFGGTIVLPPGAYQISATIVIPAFFFSESRVAILGDVGGGTSIIPGPNFPNAAPMFLIEGSKVTIKHLLFQTANPAQNFVPVLLRGSVQVGSAPEQLFTMSDCRFLGLKKAIRNENYNNWTISDCYFLASSDLANTLWIDSYNGAQGAWFSRLNMQGGYGMRFDSNGFDSEGHTITDCTMVAMEECIRISSGLDYSIMGCTLDTYNTNGVSLIVQPPSGKYVSDVYVSNTWMGGNPQNRIELHTCRACLFSNVVMEGIDTTRGANVVLRDNTHDASFSNCVATGAALDFDIDASCSGIQVHGCVMESAKSIKDYSVAGSGNFTSNTIYGPIVHKSQTADKYAAVIARWR